MTEPLDDELALALLAIVIGLAVRRCISDARRRMKAAMNQLGWPDERI